MRNIYVAGSGNWGKKVISALKKNDRYSGSFNNNNEFFNKKGHGRDILWITYPPGERKTNLIIQALNSGYNIIIEKPISISKNEINLINDILSKTDLQIAVNYQYVFCKSVNALSKIPFEHFEYSLKGKFFATANNNLNLNSKLNLGAHLIAIQQYHFPHLLLNELSFGYGKNERYFEINGKNFYKRIDLMQCSCDLLEIFLSEYEACLSTGKPYEINLEFAMNVENQ